ncbi:MAG: hypothetical protein C4540_05585 [Candidatus Omnitrophota bacterium]|nr:MAG: hypothetical protein C4540_05585 [Candidatus Omnitrophota bacterium]
MARIKKILEGAASFLQRYPVMVIIVGYILLSSSFYNVGFPMDDECFSINVCRRILQGDIPYKDFQLHVTPGSFYLQSLMFKIFGQELIINRITTTIVGVFIALLLYYLSLRIMPPAFAIFSSAVFGIWGTIHLNFLWYSWYADLFALLAVLFLLRYLARKGAWDVFLCGIFIGCTLLCKQNIGLSAFLSVIVGLSLIRMLQGGKTPLLKREVISLRELLLVGGGMVIAILPFVVYLFWNSALKSAFVWLVLKQQEVTASPIRLLYLPYEFTHSWKYLLGISAVLTCMFLFVSFALRLKEEKSLWSKIEGALAALFIVYAVIYLVSAGNWLTKMFISSVYYAFIYIPYFLVGFAVLYLWRLLRLKRPLAGETSALLLLVIFVVLQIYFGLLNSSDLIHQILVYPPLWIFVSFLLFKMYSWESRDPIKKKTWLYFIAVLLFLFIFSGVRIAYRKMALWYYSTPIKVFNRSLDIPKARMLKVSQTNKDTVEPLVAYIRAHTEKDERIFVMSFDTIFYFLTDRKSPSYFDNVLLTYVPYYEQPTIIRDLRKNKVNYVIERDQNSSAYPVKQFYPLLYQYVKANYHQEAVFGNFIILRRNTDR